MKKILIALLLMSSMASAQYPYPLQSSGELKLSQVNAWMDAADEWQPTYGSGELVLTVWPSIFDMNGKSHLSNKGVHPMSLSQWYGYNLNKNAFFVYKVSGYTSSTSHNLVCTQDDGQAPFYWRGNLDYGTILYSNSAMTNPVSNGSYRRNGMWYYVFQQDDPNNINNSTYGEIREIGQCQVSSLYSIPSSYSYTGEATQGICTKSMNITRYTSTSALTVNVTKVYATNDTSIPVAAVTPATTCWMVLYKDGRYWGVYTNSQGTIVQIADCYPDTY